MQTGYTAYIEDGDITTGKDFLLLCSRAFGVAIDIRDEPLSVPTPTHFEPNDFYKKRLDNEVRCLEELKKLPLEDVRQHIRLEHEKKVNSAKQYVTKMTEINNRYAKIRNQINAWTPPTADHSEIKKFALNQIDMCVHGDDMFALYHKTINTPLDDSDEAVARYIEEQTKYLEDEILRCKNHYEDDVKRANEKTRFMQVFVESLDKMQPNCE